MATEEPDNRVLQALHEARERAALEASDIVHDQFFDKRGLCQSPPEECLLVAMLEALLWEPGVTLELQAQIGNYRADFLITFHHPQAATELFRVVVEVDGHAFHERTKQQAARDKRRDRHMTTRGYRVLRFSGSEVWKDPAGCAEQVIDCWQAASGWFA